MAVSACVKRFILIILCGNPIMKGAFITLLSSLVLQIDAEIAILTANLGRLNFIQQLTNLEIQAVQAIYNKIQNDLNLILGPLNAASTCPELVNLNSVIQQNVVSKTVVSLQNSIYKLNKASNLATRQDAIIKQKNKVRDQLLDMISSINTLCP